MMEDSARLRLRGTEGRVVDTLMEFTLKTWGEPLTLRVDEARSIRWCAIYDEEDREETVKGIALTVRLAVLGKHSRDTEREDAWGRCSESCSSSRGLAKQSRRVNRCLERRHTPNSGRWQRQPHAVWSSHQEAFRHQRLKNDFARGGVHLPKATRLREGQPQSGHFPILTANPNKQ
jgi:hypothetical protein